MTGLSPCTDPSDAMPLVVLPRCRICGSSSIGQPVEAREMMFGTREAFTYWPCLDCGTLQIGSFPDDMARHYPAGAYYSYGNTRRVPWLKRAVLRFIAARALRRGGGRSTTRLKGLGQPWIGSVPGLHLETAILDVGSGEGAELEGLATLGFTNLTGCDPYMPESRTGTSHSGVRLLRRELAEVEERFELITMHHSLEHFADPGEMLGLARERLAQGGHILVSVPLLQPWCWARYGVHWSQLDAPRHFYLFTHRALVRLAERSGLRCVGHGYNSMGWALAWSEMYARNVSMFSSDGVPNPSQFDRSELAAFDAEAERLNAAGEGESGWFVFAPA